MADPNNTIHWTNLNKGDQYRVNLAKYKVGNIVMPNAPSTAFVDSGTTFAYMSNAQKLEIDRAFKDLCEKGIYE